MGETCEHEWRAEPSLRERVHLKQPREGFEWFRCVKCRAVEKLPEH